MNMKSYKYLIAPSLMLAVPLFANAQTANLTSTIMMISTVISLLIPVAISLALLFFIWGLVIFIKNSGEEEALEEGKRKMIWGIIALFVIIAVWGLVWFIAHSVGINPEENAPNVYVPRAVVPD